MDASGAQVVAVQGPLLSRVTTRLPLLRHSLTVAHGQGQELLGLAGDGVGWGEVAGLDADSIELRNLVDIRSQANFELAMRISTDIANPERIFYTDLNGFQVTAFISSCTPCTNPLCR